MAGRYRAEPRYNIVSLRMSDRELKALMAIKPKKVSISEYLRKHITATLLEDSHVFQQ